MTGFPGKMSEVAVIGAGIVGVSVAYHLTRSGADRVWLVEALPGPADGTSSASFAWANANAKEPQEYFELNLAGLREHGRLAKELPMETPWLHPGGNLEWAEDDPGLEKLRRQVERLRSWGYPAEWLAAARVNEALEPGVSFPGPEHPVAFFLGEAWVDAPKLVGALVDAAEASGLETRFGEAVEGIEKEAGRVAVVRLRGGEVLPVGAVVNAAGPGAGGVADLAGSPLPLSRQEGLLARLAVEEPVLGRILHTPRVNLRPDGPGAVLAHHSSVDEEFRAGDRSINSLCSELLDRARHAVPALEGAKVAEARVGVRPIPDDGLPSVGALPAAPGYYEAVTHSGVTLGPLVGRLLSHEILTGEVHPLIAPFRPERFR